MQSLPQRAVVTDNVMAGSRNQCIAVYRRRLYELIKTFETDKFKLVVSLIVIMPIAVRNSYEDKLSGIPAMSVRSCG